MNGHEVLDRNFFQVLSCIVGVALLLGVGSAAHAEIKLASPFTDHMMLQRDQDVRVFGTTTPGTAVVVSIERQTATTTADAAGRFIAVLKPLSVGGPFKLEARSGSDVATIDDVLIGDVWLCSGQSNMQMSLKEVLNAPAEIATADTHPRLRLLTVAKGFNEQRQSRFEGAWKTCTPETAADFSAVGYLFAHELYQSPKLASVPIGLIDSSFGGTAVEGWIPASELPQLPTTQQSVSMFGVPSGFFNSMIAPLAPFNVKGVLWYQGESNANHPQPYAQLLTKMIEVWRKEFQSSRLPVLLVELPPNNGDWGGYYFIWLREMQRQVALTVAGVSLATTVNTHDGSDLHPKEKHEIGTRLALLARHDVYGEDIVARGPEFMSASVDGSKLYVKFKMNGLPITARQPNALRGFALAGADGQYFFADASIATADTVVVHSERVPQPKTVRYLWEPIPHADLYNASGLPAAPFRTDDAPVEPLLELIEQPAPRRLVTQQYELSIDGAGKLTDLIVHGQQFLSNAPGGAGGTSIPQGFGFRGLGNVQDLGPGVVRFSDNEFAYTLHCDSHQLTWQFTNRSAENINFRIALAPQVKVTGQKETALGLQRGDKSVDVEGITAINQTIEGGKLLEIAVPGKGSAMLTLRVP